MVKQENLTKVELHGHKPRNLLEEAHFQVHHVKTSADGFQVFYLVLQQVQLSK